MDKVIEMEVIKLRLYLGGILAEYALRDETVNELVKYLDKFENKMLALIGENK